MTFSPLLYCLSMYGVCCRSNLYFEIAASVALAETVLLKRQVPEEKFLEFSVARKMREYGLQLLCLYTSVLA